MIAETIFDFLEHFENRPPPVSSDRQPLSLSKFVGALSLHDSTHPTARADLLLFLSVPNRLDPTFASPAPTSFAFFALLLLLRASSLQSSESTSMSKRTKKVSLYPYKNRAVRSWR